MPADTPPVLPPRLFLAGYRATGKSVVAQALARRVGYDVVDTDQLVVDRAGKDIATIFAEEGEDAFRELETEAIVQAVARSKVIISLGGGAVLRSENRERLRAAGPVVVLEAPAEVIRARMASDEATHAQRPGLTQRGSWDEVESVLAARAPLYAAVADLTLSTQQQSPDEIAQRIEAAFF